MEFTEDSTASPSRGTVQKVSPNINDKKKQTSIDIFLNSAREKLKHTTELESEKRNKNPPAKNIKKKPMMQDSGKKRKKEMPPSGKIENYFTREQDKDKGNILNDDKRTDKDDDISGGIGGRKKLAEKDIKKTEPEEGKAPPDVELALELKKTTFSVGGGGGISLVGEMIKKHEALAVKCVFGSGRCMTHLVKLERTVKKKKYSVVNNTGSIGWKYRDVTCLVCPSQERRGSVNIESIDKNLSEAARKNKNLKSENSWVLRD